MKAKVSETVDSYSWSVIGNDIAVKRTDMSVFKNHGSAVPVAIRSFFGIDGFEAGDKRDVTVVFDGTEYSAFLERTRSTARQTRFMWRTDLSDALNRAKPLALSLHEYPVLYIRKESPNRYEFRFDKGLGDYVREDLETEGLETKTGPVLEGGVKRYFGTRYERDPRNRSRAIEIHGLNCAVCGFNFEETYGEAGRNYIEVHHIKPLCEGEGPREVDAETDLVCVCSNCHRMIHRRKGGVYTIDELRNMIHESGCIGEIDGQMMMVRKIKWD